ncbi:TrbG/VirB9 family P-type conjugative transfer protein [Dickeya dadantii]|uniref:TrbG/VirB9 family P-type conjugative transfer protein n=1 Tax=Dickeya dadantii TaxID=204038 RepID=UPI001496180E|nr:TrbG/VirB9 family P-type conjugative transfer protein [Dickeya dadantii]NPE55588.1 TrbG/VirB9 family P-type conjugative transfer protein [Dickeya dadantii]NPE68978.1 TrbG/VirB9 family P-type conjugative transfer protein [Dickeya dadantii]
MRFLRIAFVIGALLSSQPAIVFALDIPVGSPYDSRIKTVMYNDEDVTQIDSVLGVATHIIVDPSEHYVTHAFGDSDAWTFSQKDNHFFIKPKAEMGDTNLTIITDKRTYNFDVRYHDEPYLKGSSGKHSFDKKMTFQVKFKYPEIEAAKKAKEADEKRKQEEFSKLLAKGVNLKYTQNGDKSLLPVNVWDAEGFTYFKFAVGQDIPSVFYVDAAGVENIPLHHSEGKYKEILVMHKIAKEWRIRYANKVAGIYNKNDGSLPSYTAPLTGTVSDKYKRVIINNE